MIAVPILSGYRIRLTGFVRAFPANPGQRWELSTWNGSASIQAELPWPLRCVVLTPYSCYGLGMGKGLLKKPESWATIPAPWSDYTVSPDAAA